MSTFDQDEASVQHSQPDEYYDIVLSTGVTYRIASGNRDLQIGSIVYMATPAARSSIAGATIDGNKAKSVELTLPVNHPVVKRWHALGSPPKQVTVTAWRRERRSLVSRQQWTGLVAAVICDGNIAKLSIPSRTADTAKRMLPTVTSGTSCSRILYDSMCKVARASFLVSTTARYVDGRNIHVDVGSSAKLGTWCIAGELVHVPTGERMTIVNQQDVDPATQTVTVLTLQMPIVELKYGDAIQVYAGCDHSITTCNAKFANQPNFFGSPYKPTKNPFLPSGLGTVEQG